MLGMRSDGFHWLVALRYLRMPHPRSAKLHILTLLFATLVVLAWGLGFLLDYVHTPWFSGLRADIGPVLRWVKLGSLVAFVLVGTFIVFVRRFTIFTTISIYGLFLGSAALVVALSIMSGFEGDLRRKILGHNAHIVVQTKDVAFVGWQAARDALAKLPGVVGASPFVSNEVMIASGANPSGAILKAIDPATAASVNDFKFDVGGLEYIAEPEKLAALVRPSLFGRGEPGDPEPEPELERENGPPPAPNPVEQKRRVLPGVLVGRELAKSLRVYLGDDVDIISPLGGIGPTGAIPKSKPFRVAGIFFSGMFEYDSKLIYIAVPSAQKFLGLEDEVTGIELKIADADRTEATMAAARTALASVALPEGCKDVSSCYEIQDWKELNRSLFSALKLEKVLMFVVLCFVFLVAGFSIIANGIMLVMEKGREIAIMKSMGAADRDILGVFLLLGVTMALLGVVTGVTAGIAACYGLSRFGFALDQDVYYLTQLPVRMNWTEIVAVVIAACAIAMLATLYPALVAARLRPVESLRGMR
jgi:lipoprotein-releasing system permease protein